MGDISRRTYVFPDFGYTIWSERKTGPVIRMKIRWTSNFMEHCLTKDAIGFHGYFPEFALAD